MQFKNRRPELDAILEKYNACENSELTESLLRLILSVRLEAINVIEVNVIERFKRQNGMD